MSKSVGNIVSLREALDRWGREAILAPLPGRALPQPGRVLRGRDGGGAGARPEDFRTAFRVAAGAASASSWDDFAAALDDDFNTPARARDPPRLARGRRLDVLRPRARALRARGRNRGRAKRPPRSSRSPRTARVRPRGRATSREADRAARRNRPPAGRCRTWPDGYRLDPEGVTQTRELVYGRRPVHEVLRAGKREVIEVLVTERARSRPSRGSRTCKRLRTEPERVLTDAVAHARPPGRDRLLRAVPLRRRLRAGRRAEAADRLPRPGHRPAQPRAPSCRSAEAAGATGVVVTERRSARVTPAVCRHPQARSSTSRSRSSSISPATWRRSKGADLWAWAAETEAQDPGLERGSDDGRLPRASAPRARESARACAAPATTRSRFRSAARSSR